MQKRLIFILLLIVALPAFSQPKKRSKVKRKYRDVEFAAQKLPQVVFRGLVRDVAGNPIPGAGAEVEGLKKLVHSNESGQFMLSDLPTGIQRVRVSSLGFQTKTIDYMLHVGNNDHYITLERGQVPLDKAVSSVQKREQQISDIPAAIDLIVPSLIENPGGTNFQSRLSTIPGADFEKTVTGSLAIYLHGTNGQSGFPELSPSVAVFSDQAPVSRLNGLPSRYFDLERIEIVKGPQNVLFGRNALNGAVHLIGKKPENKFGGFVSGGGGSFWSKNLEAAVNLPVVEDMLLVRAAGIYHDRNGYVKNSAGGTLNGDNLLGGRFSVRFMPAWNHKIDLQFNYLKSDEPGMAFINPDIPGENGENTLFDYRASLNRGTELGSEVSWMDASITYQLFRDEHNHWTSVTSFRKNNAASRWDADGTFLPALDLDNAAENRLFFQELRYNFVRRSRTNGSIGVNFLLEKENSTLSLASNEQLISYIKSGSYSFLPILDDVYGAEHNEDVSGTRRTQSAQAFMHATHQWSRRLFLTLGARTVLDWLSYSQESIFSGGEAVGEGGAVPNFFYAPASLKEVTKSSLSFTGQAGITYRLKENFNFYLNAVRGRRPQVLQFTWNSTPFVTGAERVYGAEYGWKTIVKKRIFWDVNSFYRKHFNVQTLQLDRAQNATQLAANGKATSFGGETSLKVAIIRELDLFGSYARMHSVFDSTAMDGSDYLYAGKSFARMPENSFSAGLSMKFYVAHRLKFFATPWYSWKSHFWLTEANSAGLEQPAYGLLNINFGVEMTEPKVSLAIHAFNLLEEKYLSGVGYMGGLAGTPTVVPGQPRMVEARLIWSF